MSPALVQAHTCCFPAAAVEAARGRSRGMPWLPPPQYSGSVTLMASSALSMSSGPSFPSDLIRCSPKRPERPCGIVVVNAGTEAHYAETVSGIEFGKCWQKFDARVQWPRWKS